MGQPSGVQQGHSHSAIPFAFVVGHLLEDLFKKWRDRGEHTTTRDWGWLFVDDLLCSFDSWAQARVLVPEIVEAFGRAGLRVSLKQSEVLCTLQTLEEGRALDWEPDEFLFSIPWTSCTKYLRKPLTHLKVAESTYTVLLPIMKQRVHLAREQLRQVVKGLRWRQPYLAMRLVDRYVGATFFWYLPTCSLQLLPYRRFSRSKFQSWSSCCGRSFLNMSVMLLQCFCTDSASLLFAKYGWHCIWRQRLWNYLGHVLRNDDVCSVRLALQALDVSRRPRGGIVRTPMSWLRNACKLLYPNADDLSCLAIAALASDRDQWHRAGEQHLTNINSVEQHSCVHQTTHQEWLHSVAGGSVGLQCCTQLKCSGRLETCLGR
eukprot:s2899_g11.t1